jgi:dTDP-3-amino-2,3,6-trideoxy-4-keto-D-glucose/dTDP-3-amino-3,4,6-trideoxy-alpha-D-glucose/dTDP-2,6-dideoxy-D-kanosamine transaminase
VTPVGDMIAVPVADPGRAIAAHRDEILDAIERVLASGRYVHGPEHAAFEEELASFLGVAHCAGVASGTDALELALAAVGCSPGDMVVVAANAGGYATAAAGRLGCTVVFADVDPVTLGLTAATVEPVLTGTTRAVVGTHLYGLMCGIEGLVALCGERGIAVVEDCAQSVGARRGGRYAGSFGDAATFSFYPTKNLAAIGDGGAVVTDDRAIDERLRALRQYGWSDKYRVDVPGGWNSRLDELQAAVLRVGLAHLDDRNARRRDFVRRYADALPAHAGRFVWSDGEDFVAHLAVVLANDRESLQAALAAAEIGTDIHYPRADYQQDAWRTDDRLPVTEHAVAHVLTIPCYPELSRGEVEQIAGVLSGL